MSSAKAILLGSILIAGAILFINTVQPARAALGGPYQLMHHTNPNANAGVFRLDTSSGGVSYCFIDNGSLVCTAEVK